MVYLVGNGNDIADVDGTVFRALKTVSHPKTPGTRGAYSYGGVSGVIAAALAANSEIFQFRWTDATRFAVIWRILYSAGVSTTAFAAGVPLQTELKKATGWTGQGTGGTGVNPSTDLKRRTSLAASLVASGDIRISTTAALGAGTKTLETLAESFLLAQPGTAVGTIVQPGTKLFEADVASSHYPIVLAQNEGLAIRSVAVPATGTWMFAVTIDWTEVDSY